MHSLTDFTIVIHIKFKNVYTFFAVDICNYRIYIIIINDMMMLMTSALKLLIFFIIIIIKQYIEKRK